MVREGDMKPGTILVLSGELYWWMEVVRVIGFRNGEFFFDVQEADGKWTKNRTNVWTAGIKEMWLNNYSIDSTYMLKNIIENNL